MGQPLSMGDFTGKNQKTIKVGENAEGKEGHLTILKARDIGRDQIHTLTMTTKMALALIDYSNEKMAELPEAQREPLENPSSPQAQAARTAFIVAQAPEFCEKHGEPYILDRVGQSSAGVKTRQLGIPGADGSYKKEDQPSSQMGLIGTIKAWLGMDRPEGQETRQSLKNHALQSQVAHILNINAAARQLNDTNESQDSSLRLG